MRTGARECKFFSAVARAHSRLATAPLLYCLALRLQPWCDCYSWCRPTMLRAWPRKRSCEFLNARPNQPSVTRSLQNIYSGEARRRPFAHALAVFTIRQPLPTRKWESAEEILSSLASFISLCGEVPRTLFLWFNHAAVTSLASMLHKVGAVVALILAEHRKQVH